MEEKEIGKVTHYYGGVGVAIIKLSDILKVGDTLKFVRGDEEFEEKVESMQINREDVESAKKGDEVGVKVSQKIKEGTFVYKLE